MNTVIDGLRWRYAVRKYDANKNVSEDNLYTILESMRLAPSSFGLQPWKFVVVNDENTRAMLREAAYGQPQLTEASEIIVLCYKNTLNEEDVEKYLTAIIDKRNVAREELVGLKNTLTGAITNKSAEEIQQWNAKQIYIPLGVGIATASTLGIDTGPMEGFNPQTFNDILGLTDYTAGVILSLGYRAEEDPMQYAAKVRYDFNDVVETK